MINRRYNNAHTLLRQTRPVWVLRHVRGLCGGLSKVSEYD